MKTSSISCSEVHVCIGCNCVRIKSVILYYMYYELNNNFLCGRAFCQVCFYGSSGMTTKFFSFGAYVCNTNRSTWSYLLKVCQLLWTYHGGIFYFLRLITAFKYFIGGFGSTIQMPTFKQCFLLIVPKYTSASSENIRVHTISIERTYLPCTHFVVETAGKSLAKLVIVAFFALRQYHI